MIMFFMETMGIFVIFNNIFGSMLKCLIVFSGLGLKDYREASQHWLR
jgi:hypothetical protein